MTEPLPGSSSVGPGRCVGLDRCKPLLVVMNADDLGASHHRNRAIWEQMAAGRLTSATVLANGPAFEECLPAIRDSRSQSIGVHLNLTEYEPLTSSPHLRVLLDDNGCLHSGFRYRRFGISQLCAIFREFEAQIRKVLDSGVPISHLDSHHHIHTRPDFVPMIKALQFRFSIRGVRARLNLYPAGHPSTFTHRVAIPVCNAALRMPTCRTRTTEAMGSLAVFSARLDEGWQPAFRSIELMVHPGATHPEGVAEIAALRGDWRQRLARPVRLVSFAEL